MHRLASAPRRLDHIGQGALKGHRVLIFSDAIVSRNGVGSYYEDLYEHLEDRIDHVELLSPGANDADLMYGLGVPMPGDSTQRVYLPKFGRVWRRAREVGPDIIVISTPGPYGITGLCIAKLLGVPLCAGYHTRYEKLTGHYWGSVSNWLTELLLRGLNRLFFKSSRVVVGISEEMVKSAKEDGARKVEMMGTPIGGTFLKTPVTPPSQNLTSVCYAGRLSREKSISSVLQAAEELSHIRFTIAGDGPQRAEVQALARRLDNVSYVGWLPREGARQVIDDSDMLLLPSTVEAFGTIALEAMARQRLVLVSNRCGILNWPELASGVFAMEEGETLAQTIARVAAVDHAERLEKAEIARSAAMRFNDKTLQQWLGLFAYIQLPGSEN